jgi:hypothetical protein
MKNVLSLNVDTEGRVEKVLGLPALKLQRRQAASAKAERIPLIGPYLKVNPLENLIIFDRDGFP